MRLTVGPLPPAVYWRRRALVIGIPVLLILSLVFLFDGGGRKEGGSTGSGRGGADDQRTPSSGASSPSPDDTVDPSGAVVPGARGTAQSSAQASSVPAGPPVGTAQPGVLCTDAEMQLTPYTDPAAPRVGQPVRMILKIKNVSARTCNRDVGSGPQELRMLRGADVIWSSDYCQSGKGGTDIRIFGPGVEATFGVAWDGYPVGPGCVRGAKQVEAGTYQLTARLDNKWSSPVNINVVSPAS